MTTSRNGNSKEFRFSLMKQTEGCILWLQKIPNSNIFKVRADKYHNPTLNKKVQVRYYLPRIESKK